MATDTQSLLDASNYAATTQQVSMAKTWVRDTARGLVDDETLYDLALCAAEIVDNARKHGRSDGAILVELYLTDDTVRLEVTNDSLGISVPYVTDSLYTVEGHGMQIVEALAAHWGKEKTSDHDQLVWCEFPRK
jgi:two-component sensor histidine kinase